MIKIMNIPSCPNSLSVPSCEIIYSFGSHECEEFLLSQSVAVANLCVPVTLFTHAHENLYLVSLTWKISGNIMSSPRPGQPFSP